MLDYIALTEISKCGVRKKKYLQPCIRFIILALVDEMYRSMNLKLILDTNYEIMYDHSFELRDGFPKKMKCDTVIF